MSFKKQMLSLAAVGALSAVTAIPAMAFENEFHGMYKLKYFLSNYETGTTSAILTGLNGAAPVTLQTNGAAGTTENVKMNNYFEQRARLQYTAKASDDAKLVTHFEIDSVFGDRAQSSATRGSGGALEADAVNLETKHVFIDFKIPSTPTRVTAGIQPIKDVFKGIFIDADIAGVNTVTKAGPATIGLGYFRAYDSSYNTAPATARPRGLDNLDIAALSLNYAITKDLNVGLGYYWYGDSRNQYIAAPVGSYAQSFGNLNAHVVGLNADAKIGKLSLSGFAAMQQGTIKSGADVPLLTPSASPGGAATAKSFDIDAYAFNIAAKMPVGPGNFRTAYLYTSGDDGRDGHVTGWQGVSASQNNLTVNQTAWGGGATYFAANTYNESNMMLLNRATNMQGTSTDMSLVYTSGNGNLTNAQGVHLFTFGYDATITPKLYANMNVGFAWAAKDNANKPTDKTGLYNATATVAATGMATPAAARNASNFMGTEINIETGYKMYDNLTASFQTAYVVLGGYYAKSLGVNPVGFGNGGHAEDPENPYTARFILSYAF